MTVDRFAPPAVRWALVLSLLLALPPAPAAAQSGFKSNRKWLFGLVGALAIGVPAYALAGERGLNSRCSSKSCVGLVTGAMGGIVGFMIGSELDSGYKRRMAAGPTLEYSFRDIQIDLVPDRLSGFAGGAAVVGPGGARVVLGDGSVVSRASNVRGIQDAAASPAHDLLVLSTYSSLIGFPIRGDGAAGRVIDERGGATLQLFQERLVVAGLDSLRLLELRGTGAEVAVEAQGGIETADFVSDMAFDGLGRVGWVLMENRLAAYTPELMKLGEVGLPAAGRTVRADGARLAVAAGTAGVFVLDATNPAAPELVQRYSGVRFAYAADLDGAVLYVAAGPEGVAVVDLSGAEPQVIGVARDARYVTDVAVAGDGRVWILDREGRSVQIADFGRSAAERSSSR